MRIPHQTNAKQQNQQNQVPVTPDAETHEVFDVRIPEISFFNDVDLFWNVDEERNDKNPLDYRRDWSKEWEAKPHKNYMNSVPSELTLLHQETTATVEPDRDESDDCSPQDFSYEDFLLLCNSGVIYQNNPTNNEEKNYEKSCLPCNSDAIFKRSLPNIEEENYERFCLPCNSGAIFNSSLTNAKEEKIKTNNTATGEQGALKRKRLD